MDDKNNEANEVAFDIDAQNIQELRNYNDEPDEEGGNE